MDNIEAVIQRWEDALSSPDAEALLACYARDAVLESPVAAHILGGYFAELLDLSFERRAALFQSLRREMKAQPHGEPLQPLLVCEPDLGADLRHRVGDRNHGRKITLDRGLREFISAIRYGWGRCLHAKAALT